MKAEADPTLAQKTDSKQIQKKYKIVPRKEPDKAARSKEYLTPAYLRYKSTCREDASDHSATRPCLHTDPIDVQKRKVWKQNYSPSSVQNGKWRTGCHSTVCRSDGFPTDHLSSTSEESSLGKHRLKAFKSPVLRKACFDPKSARTTNARSTSNSQSNRTKQTSRPVSVRPRSCDERADNSKLSQERDSASQTKIYTQRSSSADIALRLKSEEKSWNNHSRKYDVNANTTYYFENENKEYVKYRSGKYDFDKQRPVAKINSHHKIISMSPVLNRDLLEELLSVDVKVIGEEFKENQDKFVKLMRRCSKDFSIMNVLLKIFAKLSSGNPDIVIPLVSALRESHFIDCTIVPYLLSIIGTACKNIETVANTLKLVVWIATASISSIVSFFSILTVLSDLLREIQESDVCSDMMQSEMEDFAQIKSHIQSIRRSSDKKKRTREDLCSPPDDFRMTSVMPTVEELLTNKTPFLRKNKAYGSFVDTNHYLDVQFRLLREDFVAPLRVSIQDYKVYMQNNQGGKRHFRDIRVYNDVKIAGTTTNREGLGQILTFDTSATKQVHWENNKHLSYGSLLCLSHDNFESLFFAVVTNREIGDLEMGIIEVKFTCEPKHLYNLASKVLVMAESHAYYEAYKHNLTALQCIKKLPFSSYIVSCREEVEAPLYLARNKTVAYDLDLLATKDIKFKYNSFDHIVFIAITDVKGENTRGKASRKKQNLHPKRNPALRNITILSNRNWPDASSLYLDESQYRAVKNALTHEFSITQGPPGTGKTYVGLKIAKALLLNKRRWNVSQARQPMLIVCYTNHALDQFLCGILDFFDGNVVRVGGRSSCEEMQNRGIKTMYDHISDDVRKESTLLGVIKKQKEESIEEIKNDLFSADCKILNEFQLKMYAGDLYRSLKFGFEMEVYNINRKREENNQLDPEHFNVLEEWLGHGQLLKRSGYKVYFRKRRDHFLRETDGDELQRTDSPVKDMFYERIGCVSKTQVRFQLNESSKRRKTNKRTTYFDQITPMKHTSIAYIVDVWELPYIERWQLYKDWVNRYKHFLRERLIDYEEEYGMICQQFNETYKEKYRQALSQADIVGMTTTGAAKHFDILQTVKPKIVIVEEAAEVLEAHIVTSLSEQCEHLILIGDHKQLKPSPAVYKLAKNFNLDISLFERMINNKVAFECLDYQHRMRPEISKLVRLFYPNLKDDPSVIDRPNIKGIASNVFFVSHTNREQNEVESKSHCNVYEAHFLVALCRYLLKQEYQPSQITVLTTYSAQMFLLQRLMPKDSEFQGVTVTVVDNYQGEENDIILLSVVRSNVEENIGFLKIENRVNVALSRARNGLFVVGDFETMSKVSAIWAQIKDLLENDNRIGTSIPLFCRNHSQNKLLASTAEDFLKAPEGGCLLDCDARLNCGHVCRLKCHVYDTNHTEYKCKAQCLKQCNNGHKCRKMCFEKCGKCYVIITKEIPRCGHLQQVPCHMDPSEWSCKEPCEEILSCGHPCTSACYEKNHMCIKKVIVTFDTCDHVLKVECCKRTDIKRCEQPCKFILPCQHRCMQKCHEQHTSMCEHKIFTMLDCGHSVIAPCHEALESIKCDRPCDETLNCGHTCKEKCGEAHTQSCEERVKKTLRCGHTLSLFCSDNSDEIKCMRPCSKMLKCGHRCVKKCYQSHTEVCHVNVPFRCKYKHVNQKPCHEVNEHTKCTAPCRRKLVCGHSCRGTCFECENGYFHKPCFLCGLPNKTRHRNSSGPRQMPCVAPCRNRCSHYQCNKLCFEPCADDRSTNWLCRENCEWKCEHTSCTKLCFEQCDRLPCNRPCQKHASEGSRSRHIRKKICQGYCGEICGYESLLGVQRHQNGLEQTYGEAKTFLTSCKHAANIKQLEIFWLPAQSSCGPICPKCSAPLLIDEKIFGNLVKRIHENKERMKLKSDFLERHRQIERLFARLRIKLNMINPENGEKRNLEALVQKRKESFEKFLHFQSQGFEDLKNELCRLDRKGDRILDGEEKGKMESRAK